MRSAERSSVVWWSAAQGGTFALAVVAGEFLFYSQRGLFAGFSDATAGALSWCVTYWIWGIAIGGVVGGAVALARRLGRVDVGDARASATLALGMVWMVVLSREVFYLTVATPARFPGGRVGLAGVALLALFGLRIALRDLSRWWAARAPSTRGFLAIAGLPLICLSVLVFISLPPANDTRASVKTVNSKARMNLLLISLDTVRPDALGCYGSDRAHTPVLDRVANEGVRFENAFTPMPITRPAHVSMFTGMEPEHHGVLDNSSTGLDGSVPTLAEVLSSSGYRTGGFISAMVLDKKWGLDRGFDLYDKGRYMLADRLRFLIKPPRYVTFLWPTRGLLRWLDLNPLVAVREGALTVAEAVDWIRIEDSRPFFAFVHLFDAHWPYRPSPKHAERFLRPGDPPLENLPKLPKSVEHKDLWQRMYEAEVSYADDLVGVLLDELASLGVENRSAVVVVSDHGESFGEYYGHAHRVFDHLLRVVWIARVPGVVPAATVEERYVSLADLMPTLLDWLDVEPPASMTGNSCAADAKAGFSGREELFAASEFRGSGPWRPDYLSYRRNDRNWMLELETEALALEPAAAIARFADASEVEEAQARSSLEQHWSELRATSRSATRSKVDEATRRELEALGYLQ